ncbi:MAG: hypothetical protein M1828_003298 [Chrysothrix sp. TS-e1954]|nr:MAG: hypothetical protein M1828_003298 [Chrysothrix sp. TS-e1954]
MSSQPRQVYLAILGPTGGVGTCFLAQLEALQHRFLSAKSPTHLNVVYLARSATSLQVPFDKPISLSSWQSALSSSTTQALPLAKLAEHLKAAPQGSRSILVDNTASEQVAESYPTFLENGISVITPNKKGFSSSLPLWDAIYSAAANGDSPHPAKAGYIYHESSVGAGLPIICTLKDLLETGDMVTRIEGVFSGTMSFLFNSFMPSGGASDGGKFSDEVKKAKELGYTEPDPRDDLNGLDVARKLTILGRIAGLKVESPTSFPVQSLIPTELESCKSGDEFLSRLPEFDHKIEEVKKEAEREGKVLRYVGSIDVGKAELEVGLKKFDTGSAIGGLKGSDNVISFYTKRYGDRPLVVQGAGAGGEVTAMGVMADLVRVLGVL